MKKAIYNTHGNPTEVIEILEIEDRVLKKGEARIDVLRSPINPSDIAQIEGNYGFQPPLPGPAGMEGIGRVIEVNGDQSSIGNLVLLPETPGTWVTQQIVSIDNIVPIPEADIDQLAMLAVNPATAYLLLNNYVDLKAGDWIIVSAANSAVGRYITQLAVAQGINVAAVVRRESALEEVLQAGAKVAFIDGPDLVERVNTELDSKPLLAIDAVAGETLGRLAETLASGGTIVVYGGMSGTDFSVQIGSIIFNDITIKGFWLVHWFNTAPAEEQQAVYAELTAAIMRGVLNAPIDKIFDLEDINEALTYTLKGGRSGKVLIAPNGI